MRKLVKHRKIGLFIRNCRLLEFFPANLSACEYNLDYRDKKFQRNALHISFFGFRKGNLEYLKKQTELLISAGVDVNAVDKFNAIPLKYAITISKHTTEEMKEIYEMLIRSGSEYKKKDSFQKSCLDYAQEYSWRNGFIEIVKEIEG